MSERIEAWRTRPLVFGESDCFQFVADVVAALTGIDHRDAFPRYTSREGAMALLNQYGGTVGMITTVLGEPKPVGFASRGDVVAKDFGDGIAAAICVGAYCCTTGPNGLVFGSTADALAAWTV